MTEVRTVPLPAPATAVAADGETVWCLAGDHLVSYAADGSPRLDIPPPGEVSSLAAAGDTLAAAAGGVIIWIGASDGEVVARRPVGGEPVVVAGGGAVWVHDRLSGRAWRLVGDGVLGEPVALPRTDAIAADGERIWWTSPDDTELHGGSVPVDLGAGADRRGGLVACGGAIWVSVHSGLLRVGAWGGELGPPIAAPEGPVRLLACAGGILVGGSGRAGLFVLDPSLDADVRPRDVDLGGETRIEHLVATRAVAWAFPAGRMEARLVSVRPGE